MTKEDDVVNAPYGEIVRGSALADGGCSPRLLECLQ